MEVALGRGLGTGFFQSSPGDPHLCHQRCNPPRTQRSQSLGSCCESARTPPPVACPQRPGDSGRGVWQEAGTVAAASAQHSLGPAGLRQTGHVGLGQSFQPFPQLLGHFSCLPWKCICLYSEKLTSAVPSLDTENGNNVIASRLGQATRPRL